MEAETIFKFVSTLMPLQKLLPTFNILTLIILSTAKSDQEFAKKLRSGKKTNHSACPSNICIIACIRQLW